MQLTLNFVNTKRGSKAEKYMLSAFMEELGGKFKGSVDRGEERTCACFKATPNKSTMTVDLELDMLIVTGKLIEACKEGELEEVKTMVKLGADVNAHHSRFLNGPLVQAALNGHILVMEYLVECGADVNVNFSHPDKNRTPLSAAILGGIEAVKFLVERGAKLNAHVQNWFGEILLIDTLRNTRTTEITEYLLSKGANPLIPDIAGKTFLERNAEWVQIPGRRALELSKVISVPRLNHMVLNVIENHEEALRETIALLPPILFVR